MSSLLPSSTARAESVWWCLNNWIHTRKLARLSGRVKSMTNTAQWASRRYAGTRLLYFSWPAVSQSWRR